PKDQPFLMPVEDVFSISGRGTVVTGRIERGVIKVGEEVEIVGLKATQKTTVTGVEMFRKLLDQGEAGGEVGGQLRGTEGEGEGREEGGGGGGGSGAGQAGRGQAAHEIQGGGLHPDQGGGRAAHAVFHELSATVLFPNDGCDRGGASSGGDRDGDAWRQCDDD